MKKFLAFSLPIIAIVVPVAASAQTISTFITGTLLPVIDTIIRLLIALATLLFIIGIVRYIFAGGDEEKTKEARRFIIFAIVGLVLIVVIWGVVRIVANSFGTTNTVPVINFGF